MINIENHCDEYTVCGCSKSNDLHCMFCCRPMDTHTLIPEIEVQEIQRRILKGAQLDVEISEDSK